MRGGLQQLKVGYNLFATILNVIHFLSVFLDHFNKGDLV